MTRLYMIQDKYNQIVCHVEIKKCVLNEMSDDLKTYIERQITPQHIFGLLGFHFQIEAQFFED